VDSVEVNGNFAAVNSLPDKGLIGKGIGVIPAELRGEEILNSAALHNLGKSCRITEGIGKPEGVGFIAKLITEISLATNKLTAESLRSGEVTVALNPGCAVTLKKDAARVVFNNDLGEIRLDEEIKL
jgi:hypothetical protein